MMKQALAIAMALAPFTPLRADEFDRLDANRDGVVTREEFAQAAAVKARPMFETSEAARAYSDARRAANLRIFTEAFERGQTLTVRARLERAATVTGEMVSLAEKISDPKTAAQMAAGGYPSRSPVYPRMSHLVRLISERPWLRGQLRHTHANWQLAVDTLELRWPTEKEQPELRKLVGDPDPEIHSMAIEALASLQDPDDLQQIARVRQQVFLNPVLAVANLQGQMPVWANGWPNQWAVQDDDPLCCDLVWRQPTFAEHVKQTLHQMTGADLTGVTFEDWVAKHGSTRDSLWYWQQRLQRQFDEVALATNRFGVDPEAQERLASEKFAALRKSVRAELSALDRQTEAKVLLIAKHDRYGTNDLDLMDNRFFDPPWQTRLTKDELFNLLAGARPWPDVDWVDSEGGPLDTQVFLRIMLNTGQAFAREDVPRLQKLLNDRRSQVHWYGRAAGLVGISRLLPPATAETLDDPQTRDGYLRRAIREEGDVNTRGYVARELVRVGSPSNVLFLRQAFFDEKDGNTVHDVRYSTLEALGQDPSPVKRKLLVELLTDPRSRLLFTRPHTNIGSDWHRRPAVASINAHAGRELVPIDELNELLQDDKSAAAFDRILKKLIELDAEQTQSELKR